ncbi:hypothetical protein P8935_08090 [Telmatobacter sp. DSM 110680]|uniref:Uncharacterized protein n=1 Tax=Telmatobacter sp. DSM 110680 TaxID=3036704 RepID=A0AAU7DQC6_9BACT
MTLLRKDKAIRRIGLLLVFLLATELTARASEPTTIVQLEETLAADHGKSDKDVAKQLGKLELSERLSTLRLEKLQAGLPGEKSRQALLVLADTSAFQNLPAGEIPKLASPDRDTQGTILNKATDYIRQTLPRLPNFIVSRNTNRFENLKVDYVGGAVAVVEDQPFHFTNTTKETVTYRDGAEAVVLSPNHPEHQRGLYNWGVFGPLLQIVVTDIFSGKMGWGHWEQVRNGAMAVFRYSVPQDQSHYEVKYCCFSNTNSWHIFEMHPSYHGEISVDPDTGAILRLTIQTDIPSNHPIYRADVLVEYAPVEIAGQQYVCPTKSVSISRAMNRVNVQQGQCADYNCRPDAYVYPKNTAVNDTVYHSYHIFRSEMRILPTEDSDVEGVSPQPAQPAVTTPQP